MSFQTSIDSLISGVSVFNLALNVAGIINNKKNVALYIIEDDVAISSNTYIKTATTMIKQPKKVNILEGSVGMLGGLTAIASKIDSSGVVMSAEVVEDCKLSEHPLEDGKISVDNKVILPTEINVQVTLSAQDYQDKLALLKKYKNENQMIYVETKFGSYPNMQIVNMPCSMNINNINRLTFTIKLREVLVSGEDKAIPDNVGDSDTVDTGTQTGITKTLNSVVFG